MNSKFYIFFAAVWCLSNTVSAQSAKETWHLQSPGTEYSGIDAVNYGCLVKDTIIVAVMDGGTDPAHPDLADNIWINDKEIAANGIDDDKNGYIDDINGWNFIGGKNGNIKQETLEITRLYRMPKSSLPAGISYRTIKKKYKKELKVSKRYYEFFAGIRDSFQMMEKRLGTTEPSVDQIRNYEMAGKYHQRLKNAVVYAMNNGVTYHAILSPLLEGAEQHESRVKFQLNKEFNPRAIVGDDVNNLSEKYYGNNNVAAETPMHGTHVAGIIGAVRNNSIGGDGVANVVKLMVVRVVPDGDERDKDVANGIRYAVDNGAKIINMSFGKDFSPERNIVEEALKYASSKDVLIVQGSGNDSYNNDEVENYPNAVIKSTGERLSNFISVGASEEDGKPAYYSNYGKKSVDVFAPGTEIYSTLPDGEYGFESGTSMAGPVVSGMACVIRSCFPKLTAAQVREVIMQSAVKSDVLVPMPGNSKKLVPFSSLCASGGIVNLKSALEKASQINVN